jgi:aerotaxis receptor
MVEQLAAAAKAMDDQVVVVHGSIRVFRLTEKDKTLAEVDAVELRRQQKEQEQIAELDFEAAIEAHHKWRVTLRNAILKGQRIDVQTLQRDDCCMLGRWLYGGGQRWAATPGFSELVSTHRNFHAAAGKVGEAVNQGQKERVDQLMQAGSAFAETSKTIINALRQLRVRIEGGASAAPARRLPAPQASRAPQAQDADGDWTSF